MWINEETLKGNFLTLEPLQLEHISELKAAVQDGESWKLWYANVPRPDEMSDYVEDAISAAR